MLRTPSALSAHTLTRSVRARRLAPTRPSRAARLRLDTLETREQPGSVMTGLAAGLAGGGMLEPLAIMAGVVGPNALAGGSSPTPGVSLSAGASEKSPPPAVSSPASRDISASKPPAGSGAADESVGNAAPTAAAAIDVSDVPLPKMLAV